MKALIWLVALGLAIAGWESPLSAAGAAEVLTEREVQITCPRPVRFNNKTGFLNAQGIIVIEPRFDAAKDFSEDLASVRLGQKWGFIDTNGVTVIAPRFDQCAGFCEGFCAVQLDGKWGFIDREGRLHGEANFEMARSFSEGLAAVKLGGHWGFVDRSPSLVITANFQGAGHFSEGLAPVEAGGRWGFVDRAGGFVIAPRYFWADEFSEGLAFVEGGVGNEGYLDATGKLVIPGHFFQANPFSQGVAAVLTNAGGTYSLLDRRSHTLKLTPFIEVGTFSEGLALVTFSANGNWNRGFIDTNGTVVIPPQFRYAERFAGGLAVANDNKNRTGFIDKSGAYVWSWTWTNTPNFLRGPVAKRQFSNPVMKAKLEGPARVLPQLVTLVGNPLRRRFPDGVNWPTNNANKPTVFARNIWDLEVFEGRIFIGSGDYVNNTGPVDIYSFIPGETRFKLEYRAPDEQVSKFFVFDNKLVIPGNDPQESWDFGNVYIKEAGHWRKVRTIPLGIHCFQIGYAQKTLFTKASTCRGVQLLASSDWGDHWETVLTRNFPETFFTEDDRLCGYSASEGRWAHEAGVMFPERAIPGSARPREDAASPPRWRCGEAVSFAGGVILTSADNPTRLALGPYPLLFHASGASEASVIDLFEDANVMDVYVRGKTLFALCTRAATNGAEFENAIYSTHDVKRWRCRATFNTSSYARSFVPVGTDFYVGIGCDGFTAEPLPNSTGDILRIAPAIRQTEKILSDSRNSGD